MNTFQIVFVPLSLALAFWAFLRMRSGHTPKRAGLFWMLLWLLGALLIAVPGSTTVIANLLGIGRGSDLVFYLAILAGLWAGLYFYRRCLRLEAMLTALMRREALQNPQRGDLAETPGASADRR